MRWLAVLVVVGVALSTGAPVGRAEQRRARPPQAQTGHPPPQAPPQGQAQPQGGESEPAAQPGRAPVVSATLSLQVLLDRAGFSPGEIDGQNGSNVTRALAAFRQSEGISASGAMDPETWQRLTQRAGDASAVTTYTLSDADVAGPFTKGIPSDLVAQSKLDALNYQTALEALAERFHARPALLSQLNPGATFSTAGEMLTVPNVAPTGAAIVPGSVTVVVSKSTSALTLEDQSGRVVFHAPVTSGSRHDPLPIGTWKVNGVQQNPSFNYNPALFWDANPAHSKAKIPPGPNNPVGTVWIDISKEHYGIHGTPEPSQIGHAASHGCVRLTNWDAQRVAAAVKPGTKVIFK